MKMMKLVTVFAVAVLVGCSRLQSPDEFPDDVRLYAAVQPESTNWVELASGSDIRGLSHVRHGTVDKIYFRFSSDVHKQIVKTLFDNPNITRFRAMRGSTTVVDFTFEIREEIGSGISVCIKTTRDEARQIRRELER
jgi:hypothetical protein